MSAIRMTAGSTRLRRLSSAATVLAAIVVAGPASAAGGRLDPGRIAPALAALEMIGPRSRLVVFVSPGCERGAEVLAMLDRAVGRDAVAWVPFGWREGEDAAVASVLSSGVAGLDAFVRGGAAPGPDPRGARQRLAFDRRMYMPLASAVGRPPASPTIVLRLSGREARVWRGAPDERLLAEIVDAWRRLPPE